MGITLREILEIDYFKDFEVIAGKKGLNREVQGVAAMEAPDCFRWTIGKELVFSSGYIISQNPGILEQAFDDGYMQKSSGLLVKLERYIKEMPKEILARFEENNVPLIRMPESVAWMELSKQITTAVMNRSIQRMEIYSNAGRFVTDKSYKERKIRQVLNMAEKDMGYPAMLYDIEEGHAYYSSDQFKRVSGHYGLEISDYWDPHSPCIQSVMCDYINMVRCRLDNPDEEDRPRVSWIRIPIIAEKTTRAYFVVMESRELLDYYDEMAVRMAFLMLHVIYEQINAVRTVGNIGFENFILYALSYNESDPSKLIYQAGVQGVSLNVRYVMSLIRLENSVIHMRDDRVLIMEAFRKCRAGRLGRLVILDKEEAVLLLEPRENRKYTFAEVKELLREFEDALARKKEGIQMSVGVSMEPRSIKGLQSSMEKCRQVLRQGKHIFPREHIWNYDALGPLAWLQIPDDELERMLAKYRELGTGEKNSELLRTLKIYLENNMNYSVTAEKMFVHINTIRKRIEKLDDILHINWDDPMERLKLEILLQYLSL